MPLDATEIEKFIIEFYKQADDSAPMVWFLPYVEDDFHMVWTPTCQFDGPVGFEEFYRNLTGNLFDRKHEVHDIKIDVDGADFDILQTLSDSLMRLNVLAVGLEVNFVGSPDETDHTFHNTDRFMRRLRRAAFPARRARCRGGPSARPHNRSPSDRDVSRSGRHDAAGRSRFRR